MIRMVTKADVLAKAANADVLTFVEVGPDSSKFKKRHIVESRFLPLGRVRELASVYLPDRTAEIVVYSHQTGPEDPAMIAAHELELLGYGNIYYLIGGLEDWYWGSYPVNAVHIPPQ
ncbi:MAG: hypothetical protein A2Z97_01785 [Bdellovibrionales bacterium GWB1_52_6]|nr:MAG: hypothetical protein A2Z97_01785 [Bdellovibrionales bacterium GWB1_52_6]OFZ04920.1 MAG: hypothetical protein A2X97_16285 [Bdellovibrionales bacterium GWA1_52_35]HCM38856.1 hypothetical protein [Bdellovibrionales bacterium]